ncbi:MAG: (2Fe-2S)-binding protein, partial [Hyphomicrobiaceae bacterium]|nr:(2Fe-2S)-binding protein [Hyphomicrobiaceae bacterium]
MAKLNVNGETVDVSADGSTPLLWVLREQLGLTGTKYGCGIAACGACTVHIDGQAVLSCVTPLDSLSPNQKITTIEALSRDASHPVQKAWREMDVPQCGYCQSGMIMNAAALLAKTPKPSDEQISEHMTNICRCGTYQRVREAI